MVCGSCRGIGIMTFSLICVILLVICIQYFCSSLLQKAIPSYYEHDLWSSPRVNTRFYVALTATSSILSLIIVIFEVWYFKKYGESYIENLSITYLGPILNGQPLDQDQEEEFRDPRTKRKKNEYDRLRMQEQDYNYYRSRTTFPHKNYMRLLRGAEYRRFQKYKKVEPVPRYSREQTDRDLKEWFTCELDKYRRCDAIMSNSWSMYNFEDKIDQAKRALEVAREHYEQSNHFKQRLQSNLNSPNGSSLENDLVTSLLEPGFIDYHSPQRPNTLRLRRKNGQNSVETISSNSSSSDNSDVVLKSLIPGYITPEYDCALACVMLAEEEAQTIIDCERWFRRALLAAEYQKEKSADSRSKGPDFDQRYQRDYKLVCYIKSRLALCCRRLGKLRESLKLYREITRDYSANSMSIDSVHDFMLEVYLEQKSYADVQSLLRNIMNTATVSTTVVYTQALLRIRAVFGSSLSQYEPASILVKKYLTEQERLAIEAIHEAVEYNPHVAPYLLEQKPLILPGEHILRRGDSDAIAYAFWHIRHWKRIPGALVFLEFTWEGAFNKLPHHIDNGLKYIAYPANLDQFDKQILPTQIHKVSVYPKNRYDWAMFDFPFFILLVFMLFVLMGSLSILLHYFPDQSGHFAAVLWSCFHRPVQVLFDMVAVK